MKDDGLTQLAKMFKDRDSVTPPSITTGTVVASPPDPVIALNDVIKLDKTRLVFAASIVSGYERTVKFTDMDGSRTMTWTDTLQPGDEVILVPVMDSQLYYVIDKAVRY